MESPDPEIDPEFLAMADEIFGEETLSDHSNSPTTADDFESDDTLQDPTFDFRNEAHGSKQGFGSFFSSESDEDLSEVAKLDENINPNIPILNENDLKSLPSSYTSGSELNNSPQISRKRQINATNWKQNVRKKLRQQGKAYISSKGVPVTERKIKSPCVASCCYLCTKNFDENDRKAIFESFWGLNDDLKNTFYNKFVTRKDVQRRRVAKSTKKSNTFLFYLQKETMVYQVCRAFFLNTLSISDKRIYYHFQHLRDNMTGVAKSLKRGKHIKRCVSEELKEKILNHIKSFPTVDSHYCRASSSRKYLEESLSLSKMFSLFQEKYPDDIISSTTYTRIFNKYFNLGFFKPKKDQCDRCVMYKNMEKENLKDNDKQLYESHKKQNSLLKIERDIDRNNVNQNTLIICFDLQSVFTLPKGFSSIFYYKRKLTVFNMTATVCSKSKQHQNLTYCAIWSEVHSARSGNDIASSLIKTLRRIMIDFKETEHIVLWSDSCVPQNKNQIMTTAMLQFMFNHKNGKTIIQKFSEPGHSQVQEIDAVHSAIDKYLKYKEIYSPLDLVKKLHNYNSPKVKLQIIQMIPSDFKNYSEKYHKMIFQKIPFSRIKTIKYSQDDLFTINFKTSADEIIYKTSNLLKKPKKGTLPTPKNIFELNLKILDVKKICADKKNDIKSIYKFLPKVDVQYYQSLLK